MRRRNQEMWHHLNRLVTAAIFLVVVGVVVLAFYPEWTRREALARQLGEEREKLVAEQLLQEQRSREVVLLQTDPEYVEIIARDKIGVMKEGETIFRLDVGKPPVSGPAAGSPARP